MAITTGPEFNKLWDRLEKMNTKNFHADWGDASFSTIEEKAKQINFALDQIESGAATILTNEDLKDI